MCRGLGLVLGVVLGVGALSGAVGCLDRPVTASEPTIKTNFTSAVNQSGINKVDILFDIDNSASMGDKQAYLIQAIPQLIARLVTPNCVDSMGNDTGSTADPTFGMCPAGRPGVHRRPRHAHRRRDLLARPAPRHASNGPPVSYVCDPSLMVTSSAGATVSAYNDDQGHLINRTSPLGSGPALPEASLPEGGGFLTGSRRQRHRQDPGHPAADDHDRSARQAPRTRSSATSPSWSAAPASPAAASSRSSRAGTASSSSPIRTVSRPSRQRAARPRGRGRHDHPPAAARLPPSRLARGRHRPQRRERLRDRRPLLSGSGYLFMSNLRARRGRPPRARRPGQLGLTPPVELPLRGRGVQRRELQDERRASRREQRRQRLGLQPHSAARAHGAEVRARPAVPAHALLQGLTSASVPNRIGEYPSAPRATPATTTARTRSSRRRSRRRTTSPTRAQ